MRKIIASVNITLNGFMAGVNGSLDWHFPFWDETMTGYSYQQLDHADTLLLGRRTYQSMAAYWPYAAGRHSPSEADMVFAERMNAYQKIVFSRSLSTVQWQNSLLIQKNIFQHITHLKQQPGKDMIILGSGSIVRKLTRLQLIDEYCLWIHPVVLSSGISLFQQQNTMQALQLQNCTPLPNGIIIATYNGTIQ